MKNAKQTTSTVALIALLSAAPVMGFAQSADSNTDTSTTAPEMTAPTANEAEAPMTDDTNQAAETEAPMTDSTDQTAQSTEPMTGTTDETAQSTEPMTGDTAQTAETTDPMATDSAQTAETETPAKPVEGQITMQGENTILAGSLIGSSVYSASGESIGDIDDLIVNLDGTVDGVVIGVGGFLGIGEKDVAIEMASLSTTTDDNGNVRLMSNATKADLEAADPFMTAADQAAARQSLETMPANENSAAETDG
jgi:sporulation protein YlmC with PRC-barrel domain